MHCLHQWAKTSRVMLRTAPLGKRETLPRDFIKRYLRPGSRVELYYLRRSVLNPDVHIVCLSVDGPPSMLRLDSTSRFRLKYKAGRFREDRHLDATLHLFSIEMLLDENLFLDIECSLLLVLKFIHA
jgi:hypothetical protein